MTAFAHEADFFRWANVILAFAAVMLLTAGTVARWKHMPARIRRAMPWVIATYAVIAYGSGEIASSHDPVDPGLRVALMLLILLGLVGTLLFGLTSEDYET